jgi:hypothetical protein
MSSTDEFSDRSAELGEDMFGEGARVGASPRVRIIAVLVLVAAIAAVLALYALAGQRLLAIWSALALLGWMFVAGAARASSD